MKIVAIIVTYNPDVDLLKKQNVALANQADSLIYVDNHSESLDFFSSIKGDNVHIIKNAKNLGLAKAQNQGIELAKANDADFVLLFDQDSIPPLGFVCCLKECYETKSKEFKVALVGPAIKNFLKGNTEYEPTVILKGTSIKRTLVEDATEVSYCIASGSLIPMKVIEEVGKMEEKLFIDGLDLEWCLRAKNKGYKIYQTCNTYLEHCLGNGSRDRIKSHSPLREYYIMRNAVWMIKQSHIPIGYRIRKLYSSVARLIRSIFTYNSDYVKSDLRGIIDGFKL